ncbi:DNA/RNA helicase domain-containing protein [Prevotella sp.]|uniref:DNA/RNA helicase domain-containing protein n=1 Tax=Prevotella sp. TaxID=59823 RepID=UPI003F7E5003
MPTMTCNRQSQCCMKSRKCSFNALEDTLTEFKVQGLEIDWACVAWDADFQK